MLASRFRRNAFGWRSQPAVARVREAVVETRKVARKDPAAAAEGAVLFLTKVSAALAHVDGSSGAIGTAVNRAVGALAPIIAGATEDEASRSRISIPCVSSTIFTIGTVVLETMSQNDRSIHGKILYDASAALVCAQSLSEHNGYANP
jgi:hypothetical protein